MTCTRGELLSINLVEARNVGSFAWGDVDTPNNFTMLHGVHVLQVRCHICCVTVIFYLFFFSTRNLT